ncbi:MAG: PIN domain-containing protein [Deltaproteobacteria bacterium]|nr:PIN domain-containing protein [Deltaproteobacteria bacterium]
MILCDVNVLVAAFRRDNAVHLPARTWLSAALVGREPVGLPDSVLVAVVRLVTSARIFTAPSTQEEALAYVCTAREAPRALRVVEGERYFAVFRELCVATGATGRMVPDAALAALAIEQGAILATLDGGFGRFPRLTWMDPLDGVVRRNPAR